MTKLNLNSYFKNYYKSQNVDVSFNKSLEFLIFLFENVYICMKLTAK